MIRFIEPKDKLACIAMLNEFYNSEAVLHNIPLEHIENSVDLALAGNPYSKIIICEIEGKYAGFCNISFTHSTEAGGLVLLIEEIYIKSEFQGQGLGSYILNFLKKEYDLKVKRYRLEVTASNTKAVKLYEKYGFKTFEYKQMILEN